MGWYDYFVNQDNATTFRYEVIVAAPVDIQYTVFAGNNMLFPRYGSGSAGWCLVWLNRLSDKGSTRVFAASGNQCQNFEFVLDSQGNIVEWDGYIGRPPGPIEQRYPPTARGYYARAPAMALDHTRQRALGRKLAGPEASPHLKAMIKYGASFRDIFSAAASEFGTEKLLDGILAGPAEWAYQALLNYPMEGKPHDALVEKVSQKPKWAFYTARDVPTLSPEHRRALLTKVASHPTWAQYALQDLDDLGEARAVLEKAAAGAEEHD